MPEELGDKPLLGGRELRRMARPRPCPQGLGTAVPRTGQPTAHGLLADAQGSGDIPLIPALLLQLQGPQPPPFANITRDKVRRSHPAILGTRKLDRICAAVSNTTSASSAAPCSKRRRDSASNGSGALG